MELWEVREGNKKCKILGNTALSVRLENRSRNSKPYFVSSMSPVMTHLEKPLEHPYLKKQQQQQCPLYSIRERG